jgi:hypothetical protein
LSQSSRIASEVVSQMSRLPKCGKKKIDWKRTEQEYENRPCKEKEEASPKREKLTIVLCIKRDLLCKIAFF